MRIFTEVALEGALKRVREGEFDKHPFIKNLILDLQAERGANTVLSERLQTCERELVAANDQVRQLTEARARHIERMRDLKTKVDAIPLEELPDV